MLAPPEEPPTRNVLPFNRGRTSAPTQDAVLSKWARHIILCVDDAFPGGTVRSLQAARPQDCFAIIDDALDAGEGSRYLRIRPVWENLESELMSLDDRDYQVITCYVAPTHAHVLIREAERFSLEATVERWKAGAIHDLSDPRALERRIWAPGYYDTILFGPREIEAARMAINVHQARPTAGKGRR